MQKRVLPSGAIFRISIFDRSAVSVGDLGFMWEMMQGQAGNRGDAPCNVGRQWGYAGPGSPGGTRDADLQ